MGKEEKMHNIIKYVLRYKAVEDGLTAALKCPGTETLDDFLAGRLNCEEEERLIEHCAQCESCLSALALAQEANQAPVEQATAKMIARAQMIMVPKKPSPLLRYKWLVGACLCFILSFLIPRYFAQLLVLAVILSLKWIFDAGSTRTLIMIYEAWRKKDSETAQRIIRDLKEHIEQRK
ncbi:MAG: hypothetical protein V1727_06795 [Candidatus Omnitrophota bacterium]